MHSHASAAAAALCGPLAGTSVVSSLPPAGGPPLIGTHNGTFHCDEALACGMLKLLPAYRDSPVLRTRTPAALAGAAIVVDVGGVFDAAALRFDHHQASFTDVYRAGAVTKLSSAGLVFRHFGPEIVRAAAAAAGGAGSAALDAATLARLVERTYDGFILEVDAIDNGVETAEAPRYRVGSGLSARVGRLNPSWNEASDEATVNARFAAAMALATGELVEIIVRAVSSWLPARAIIAAARAAARQVHPSGAILRLDTYAPWKEHLFELEAEDAAVAPGDKRAREDAALPLALYILYADSNGSWRVQAVPVEPESFASRRALPAPWRGLRDEELAAAAGVPGAIFVHAGGFIGGASTYEGALALAVKALEFQ